MSHELAVETAPPFKATCSCGKWELEGDDRDQGQAKDWAGYNHRRHVEAVEDEQRLQNFYSLAQQIVKCMPGWEFDERVLTEGCDEWRRQWQHFKNKDGAIICLHFAKDWRSKKYRISVNGEYPKTETTTYPYRDKQPESITVSPDREPSTIAKDILRRFAPAYLEAYALGVKQKNEHDAFTNGRQVTHDKLLKVMRELYKRDLSTNKDFQIHTYRSEEEGGYADLKVDAHDRIDIDCRNVTTAQAIKIVKIIFG